MYNISEQDRQILIKAVEDKNLKVVFNLQEKYKDDKVIKVCYAKLIAASNKPEDIKRAIKILQKIRSKGPSKMTLFELAKLNKTIGNFELAKDYLMEAYLLNDSFNDIIFAFGHSKGNEQTYNRYKDILTTLQGAGLIKFRTDIARTQGRYGKTLYVYQVNKKASQEWLDKNKEDTNE